MHIRLPRSPLLRTLFLSSIATVVMPVWAQEGSEAQTIIPPGKFTQLQAVSSSPPIRTAAESLRRFLQKVRKVENAHISAVERSDKAPAAGTIILGTTADSPILGRWVKEGRLSIRAAESSGDAYEIALLDGCVVVNGANARAVLYGAFELEDVIAEQGGVPANLARRAAPILGQRLLHPRVRGSFGSYRQSDFAFLARCGGNVAHLMHDWMPEKTLLSFVPSVEFPQAVEPGTLQHNRARLSQYLEWCKLYGLEGAMWFTEIPCQGGPWVREATRKAFLDHFPAECLSDTGTYQGRVLCLAHPRVEREYRRMVRQFLTDFPGISMFLVFTADSSGELCDPGTCPRHHRVSKLTQYNRLLALMTEEGRKLRPDFQVFSVGWGWKFRSESDFFRQQTTLPAGAGLTMPPDGEAWSFDRKTTDLLVKSRGLTRQHGQSFLGYDILLWGDDTVFGEIKASRLPSGLGITKLYDFPLGIAAKLQRWKKLGADGFFDQWGTMAEYVQGNAVALRELLFHPQNAEPGNLDAWAQSLASRRFGAAAAAEVLAAWKEIEVAQQIQSDHVYYWHGLRPAWAGPSLTCPLTVEALQAVTPKGPEPSKPDGTRDYSPYLDDVSRAAALGPALNAAAEHFAHALAHLQAALPLVGEESRTALDHWYQPEPGAPARFTPRQMLDEQMTAVRLQEKAQRRMSRFFKAFVVVKKLPPPGTPGHAAALKTLEQLRSEDESAWRG